MFLRNVSLGLICFIIMVGLSACGDERTAPKFVIANVLDKELFDDCHIKGSVNIPFAELEKYALEHWDKDTTEVVIHCSNYACTASGLGYTMLTKLGFKKVWAFEGGTAEAKNEGVPVEGVCEERYLLDYKKPEGYTENESVRTISAQELKKKMQEFALSY